jgi:hypothetical protein
MAAPVVFTKVRATPHQIVYALEGANASDLTYATLLADAVDGPLKSALVAAAGLTDTAAKAIACLLTGSFPLAAVSSGFSDIQATSSAALPGVVVITVGAGVDAGNSPKLIVETNNGAPGTGYLYVTHRWSPTV